MSTKVKMDPVAFVYRQCFGQWWAELFVEAAPGRAWNDNPLMRHMNPPRPEGMTRESLSLHINRWGARRSARLMKERYLGGLPQEKVKRHEVVE